MAASPSARTCSTRATLSSSVRRRGGGGGGSAAPADADDGRWRRMAAPTPHENTDAAASASAASAAARVSSASSARRRQDDSEPAAEKDENDGRAAAACSAAVPRGCGTYIFFARAPRGRRKRVSWDGRCDSGGSLASPALVDGRGKSRGAGVATNRGLLIQNTERGAVRAGAGFFVSIRSVRRVDVIPLCVAEHHGVGIKGRRGRERAMLPPRLSLFFGRRGLPPRRPALSLVPPPTDASPPLEARTIGQSNTTTVTRTGTAISS
jgi:hypothetical protein